jgi:predicted MFS family arabinose efflux permease
VTIFWLVGALWLLQDYREVKQVSYKGFWDISPSLRQLALVRAFLYAGRDFWLVLALPLYLSSQGVSKVKVGLVLALGLVSFGVLQPVVGWWIKKAFVARGHVFKRPWLYEDVVPFATAALMLVPVAMIFLKDNLIAVAVLVVVYNFLSALSTAPHNDLHLRFAKEERASMDIACYKSIAQLGKVLAVMASGIVYQWAGLEGCLTASTICLALAVAMGIPMTLRSRQSPQAQRFIAKYVMKL